MDDEQIKELLIEQGQWEERLTHLKPNALILLQKLFLNIDYPYNSLTLRDAQKIVHASKKTASITLNALVEAGFLRRNRDFITFYYPLRSVALLRAVRKTVFGVEVLAPIETFSDHQIHQ